MKVSDGSLFVQDRFEYGLADKQNAIEKSLEDAETVANKNDVFINFASTKGSLPVGHSYFFAKKMNERFLQSELEDKYFGRLIFDYATSAGQNRGTSQDLKAVSEALSYLRQKGLSTVEDLEAFLESSEKSAADYRNQMKPKEARSKVIDGILASRTDCKECKPVYEKYQKIFFKKTKEKFKQEHPEVARYAKAAAYLAKHPDDKDSTQKELQEEQETLLEEIAALKTPLTEVQEDLKKLRDIRYWVRKATPGTEESKEPPKKQPIKEVLQDKADEKKAQRTAPAQAKHRQQDMEL